MSTYEHAAAAAPCAEEKVGGSDVPGNVVVNIVTDEAAEDKLAIFNSVYEKMTSMASEVQDKLTGKVMGVLEVTLKVDSPTGATNVPLSPIFAISGDTPIPQIENSPPPGTVMASFSGSRDATAAVVNDAAAGEAALALAAMRFSNFISKLALFYENERKNATTAATRAARNKAVRDALGVLKADEGFNNASKEDRRKASKEAKSAALASATVSQDEVNRAAEDALRKALKETKVYTRIEASNGQSVKVEGKAWLDDTIALVIAFLKERKQSKAKDPDKATKKFFAEGVFRRTIANIGDAAERELRDAGAAIDFEHLRRDIDGYSILDGLDYLQQCIEKEERTNAAKSVSKYLKQINVSRETLEAGEASGDARAEAKATLFLFHRVAPAFMGRMEHKDVDDGCRLVFQVLRPHKFSKNVLLATAQCAEDNAIDCVKKKLEKFKKQNPSSRVVSASCHWTCTAIRPGVAPNGTNNVAIEPLCTICAEVFEDTLRKVICSEDFK